MSQSACSTPDRALVKIGPFLHMNMIRYMRESKKHLPIEIAAIDDLPMLLNISWILQQEQQLPNYLITRLTLLDRSDNVQFPRNKV